MGSSRCCSAIRSDRSNRSFDMVGHRSSKRRRYRAGSRLISASGANGLVQRWNDGEDRVHLRKFEELLHVGTGPGDNYLDPFGAARDVMADEDSQTRGVHLRHLSEIEDVAVRSICAGFRLELEDISELYLLHRSVHITRVKNASYLIDESARCLALNSFDCECGAFPHFGPCGCHLLGL